MKENGVIYFKNKQIYPGDVTKNCGLTGAEIDANFHFLRGREITAGLWDEDSHSLIFKTLDNNDIVIQGFNVNYVISFSGSSYDSNEGVLTLSINGNELILSGFSNCNCEVMSEELQEISALTQDILSILDNHGDIIEDIQNDIVILGGKYDKLSKKLDKEINSLIVKDDELECKINNLKKKIESEISKLSFAVEKLDERISQEEIRAMNKENVISGELGKLNDYTKYSIERGIEIVQTNCLEYSLNINGKSRGKISIPKSQMLKDVYFEPHASKSDWEADHSVVVGDPYLVMTFLLSDGNESIVYIPVNDIKSKVVWEQEYTGGTKIASITIDGKETDVFAPTGGAISIDDIISDTKEMILIESKDNKIHISFLGIVNEQIEIS